MRAGIYYTGIYICVCHPVDQASLKLTILSPYRILLRAWVTDVCHHAQLCSFFFHIKTVLQHKSSLQLNCAVLFFKNPLYFCVQLNSLSVLICHTDHSYKHIYLVLHTHTHK